MLHSRIIPILLLQNKGLVKTLKFEDPKYIGDPMNAVKIFNEKEVDEIILLDITATRENRDPDKDFINEIANECFMPFTYGGGIRTIEDMRSILRAGAEKVSINTAAVETPDIISKAASVFGSQSIVISIDVKKNEKDDEYNIFTHGSTQESDLGLIEYVSMIEKCGAGEILINSIDRDGTMIGYDIELIKKITDAVSIPVIACGGAGRIEDLSKAIIEGKASAAAAGSYFVFCGSRNSILITYPEREEIEALVI